MLTFLMKYERLEFDEAVEMLAQTWAWNPREQGRGPIVKVDEDLYTVWVSGRFIAISCEVLLRQWIISRVAGLQGNCRDFGIGYAPQNGTGR